MILTKEIFDSGLSSNGGYNSKQLKTLGVDIRFNKGWKWRIIGSDIPKKAIDKFLELKDIHLNLEPKLFPEDQAHLDSIKQEIKCSK